MVILEGLCWCGQEVSTSVGMSCSHVENHCNVLMSYLRVHERALFCDISSFIPNFKIVGYSLKVKYSNLVRISL